MDKTRSTSDRILGLDSIRFVCALWVFFGHDTAPPFAALVNTGSKIGYVMGAIADKTWTGIAAVIIFFIISGFCIHYPFTRAGASLKIGEFYTRRFIRILIPVAVAIPISNMAGDSLNLFNGSILWSLAAELIYYTLYPLLRIGAHKSSWRTLIIISYIGALGVAMTNPTAVKYPSFGLALNWALGLPCWLLGCLLAEWVRNGAELKVTRLQIWAWRLGLYVTAMICIVLRFRHHSAVGFPWTLNFFAIFAVFWLRREITFYRAKPPFRFLEWAGLWSYSLYLMHMPARALFAKMSLPNLGLFLNWSAVFLFVLAFCYIFYLLVEKPGHELAKRASKLFRNSPATRTSETAASVVIDLPKADSESA